MPTYDYICESCGYATEIFHSMSNNETQPCPKCKTKMSKQLGCGYAIIHNESQFTGPGPEKPTNKPIQRTHEGKGSGRGKALGGQHFEVDRQEFIKAAAKDPVMVKVAQDAVKKSKENK